ncbi:phosphoserine phosphatase, partial [Candidatus Woesearchaeota archaeon]|nr:phosphoserine phosphatase [Candidatus Woesearchaeota archaeon]
QQKAAEQRKQLSNKADEVRQKLMRGEKLTTEDILILQGAEK